MSTNNVREYVATQSEKSIIISVIVSVLIAMLFACCLYRIILRNDLVTFRNFIGLRLKQNERVTQTLINQQASIDYAIAQFVAATELEYYSISLLPSENVLISQFRNSGLSIGCTELTANGLLLKKPGLWMITMNVCAISTSTTNGVIMTVVLQSVSTERDMSTNHINFTVPMFVNTLTTLQTNAPQSTTITIPFYHTMPQPVSLQMISVSSTGTSDILISGWTLSSTRVG
jgi:hypothetical protein